MVASREWTFEGTDGGERVARTWTDPERAPALADVTGFPQRVVAG